MIGSRTVAVAIIVRIVVFITIVVVVSVVDSYATRLSPRQFELPAYFADRKRTVGVQRCPLSPELAFFENSRSSHYRKTRRMPARLGHLVNVSKTPHLA
jgi:hypothetical protein